MVVVTGRGNHSKGAPVLKQDVMQLLQSKNIEFSYDNDGRNDGALRLAIHGPK